MLNSLLGNTSAAAPKQHIETLFNQYAVNYDVHMKEKLHYKVPELLRQAISKYILPNAKAQNVIDLGCGTGQCGILFRDLANFMLGVDLSYHMLIIAKNIGAYDAVCQTNLNAYIPGLNKDFFDLALAGDVLVYMGDLNPFFANCTTLIKVGGKLLFTVEKSMLDEYILLTTGRYAHSHKYIEQIAEKYGFIIEEHVDIIPRRNNGEPIAGSLYVLCKSIP
jgi:predicted TPR repeat methyltransferase